MMTADEELIRRSDSRLKLNNSLKKTFLSYLILFTINLENFVRTKMHKKSCKLENN